MRRRINIIIVSVLLLVGVFSLNAYGEELGLELFLDGEYWAKNQGILYKEGHTYVPLRPIVEQLGFKIDYIPKTKTILIEKSDILIKNVINTSVVEIGNEKINILEKTFIRNGSTYIPIQSLGDILEYDLNLDIKNNVILLGNYNFKDRTNVYSYENMRQGYEINIPKKYEALIRIEELDNGDLSFYSRKYNHKIMDIKKIEKPILLENALVMNYENGNYIQAVIDLNINQSLSDMALEILQGFNMEDSHSDFYENEKLGFKIYIPYTWKGKVNIEEIDNTVYFNHINRNDKSQKPMLFGIERLEGELITDEDIAQGPTPKKIIMKDSGYTFLLTTPSDIQYDPEDKENTISYNNMREDIEMLSKTIKPYKLEKIKASTDGYVLHGTSFFTVELTENMDLEKSLDNDFLWNIKWKEKLIGELELVRKDYEKHLKDMDSFYIDKDGYRKLRFSLEKGRKEQLDRIGKTIKIRNDIVPTTTIDEMDILNQYILGGGSEISGKILKGDMKKIVLDIDGKRKEYKIDYPRIIFLENGRYNLYGFDSLSQPYMEENKDYKNKYYRFILDNKDIVRGMIEIKNKS